LSIIGYLLIVTSKWFETELSVLLQSVQPHFFTLKYPEKSIILNHIFVKNWIWPSIFLFWILGLESKSNLDFAMKNFLFFFSQKKSDWQSIY